MTSTLMYPHPAPVAPTTPEDVVRQILSALGRSDIADATRRFSEDFTFVDHALSLTFTEKEGLANFLHQAVQSLHGSAFNVESATVSGERVVAQWTLSGYKEHESGALLPRRTRVLVKGVCIATVSEGKVTSWADYYDASQSWRFSLLGTYAQY